MTISLVFISCAELQKTAENATRQSINKVVVNTTRKIQNKIESKVEAKVDSLMKPSKPYKRISETKNTTSTNK